MRETVNDREWSSTNFTESLPLGHRYGPRRPRVSLFSCSNGTRAAVCIGINMRPDHTHRRSLSPFGLAIPRPSETFCSRAIAKLRVLVAIDPARSGPRRRPLATRSRGEAGKCQDRLAPGKAMQLRAARLESSRVLALDAIGAGEDDGTGPERHRNAEPVQRRSRNPSYI